MHIRDAFIEFTLAQQADGRSRKTVKWYQDMIARGPHNLFDWLDGQSSGELETISTSLLRQYIAWMREQPHARTGKPRSLYTINAILRCLHKFFHWCSDEYQIINPMKGKIKYPKNPPPEPKAVKLETAITLILSCGDDLRGVRNRAMLMFFLSTGARREGVATLTTERLDLRRRRATVIEKGNLPRVVVFDDLTAQALSEWFKVREPVPDVFYNMRSKEHLTGDGIKNVLESIALKAGITERYNPHGWRHLFAQLYHQAGGSIAALSKLMGHKSTRVTAEIYLNLEMDSVLQDYDQRNPMREVQELLKKQEHPEK